MTPEETTITPEVAEKKVSEAVEDIVEDEDFLIEEDGDFFWVIQRIAWGIIKTLFALGIIGVLIWVIWGINLPFGSDNSEQRVEISEQKTANKKKKEEPVKKPKEKPKTKTEPETLVPAIIESDIVNDLNLERFAYQLAASNINLETGSTIARTTRWLKQVKVVGDISTDILRQTDPANRASRIEATIREAEGLLNESPILQRDISEEFNFFFNLGQQQNEEITTIDQQISQALNQFDGPRVEALLSEKIQVQQSASGNLAQAKVRQTLLQNVQNFDRLLRQKSIPLLRPTQLRANPR